DAANGTRLHVEQLHGPVAHLTLAGQTLYAATELGDRAAIDLRVFHQPRCKLWREVPVVWEPPRGAASGGRSRVRALRAARSRRR
ncbi:MAG TPA: hypothetical protein VGK67_14565, partial [Myxococcales bacterium]